MTRSPHQVVDFKNSVHASAVPVTAGTGLDELVVDDSVTEGTDTPRKTKNGRIIKGLRLKIARRFSRGKDAGRSSPVTVGKSTEEIARRAELRRLRCQRIQAELKREEISGWGKEEPTKNAHHAPSLATISHPGGGPRDTIEFAVPSSLKYDNSAQSTVSSTAKCGPIIVNEGAANTIEGNHAINTVVEEASQTSAGDLPSSGADGNLQCQVLDKPTTVTFAPEDHTTSIRPKSCNMDHSSPLTKGQEAPQQTGVAPWDGQSALGIWIIAQGLTSPECSSINLDPNTADEITSETKASGDVDNSQDSLIFESVEGGNEMPYNSKPTMDSEHSSTSTGKDRKANDASCEHVKLRTPTGLLQSPSQELAEKCALAMAYSDNTKDPPDNGSSNYTSAIPSFQASPARSESNLPSLKVQDLHDLELSPFPGKLKTTEYLVAANFEETHPIDIKLHPSERSEEYHSYTTANDVNANSQGEPSNDINDIHTMSSEDVPLRKPSLFQREMELESIQKRFGDVMYQKKDSMPRNSKFKEDFAKTSESKHDRTSLIDKIHLSIPRRSKEASHSRSSIDTSFLSPTSQSPGSHSMRQGSTDTKANGHSKGSSRIYLRPEQDESATDLWGRAIRLEAEQRRSAAGNSGLYNSDFSLYPERSRTNQVSRSSCSRAEEPSGLAPTDDERAASPTHGDIIFPRPVITSILSPMDSKFQRETPTFDSWTRFPSHTRQERNRPADDRDQVNPRDFAVRLVSDDGQVCWSTDRSSCSPTDGVSLGSGTLPSRLGKAVKSGLSRIFLTKDQPNKLEPAFREGFGNDPRVLAEIEFAELEALAARAEQKESRKFQDESQDTDQSNSIGAPVSASPEHATRLCQTDGAVANVSITPRRAQAKTSSLGDISDERHSTSKSDIFHTPLSSNIALNTFMGSSKHQSVLPIKSSSTMNLRSSQSKLDCLWHRSFAFMDKKLSPRSSLPSSIA